MKIDERVEPLVREAFGAGIAQDEEKVDSAIHDLTARGDEFFDAALKLGLEICFATLITVREGQRPDDEQLRYLAQKAVEVEAWAGLDEGKVLTFLTAVAGRTPVDAQLSLAEITPMVFVVGAYLLGSFLPPDKDWFDLLEEVEAWLESMPAS